MATGMKTSDVLDFNDILYDFETSLEDYKKEARIFKQMLTRPFSRQLIRVAVKSMTMDEIAEGSTPDFQKTKYLEFNVTVKEYALSTGVTRVAVEDSSLDEIQYALSEALEAAARRENQVILDALKTGWYNGVPGDVVGGEIPDYGGSTFTTTHSHVTDLGGDLTGKTLLERITASIKTIREHGYTPDTMIINAAQMQELMDLASFTFVNTSAAGGTNADFNDRVSTGIIDEMSTNGRLGRIYGLNVIVNQWIDPAKMCIVDTAAKPMAWVEIRSLTLEEGGTQFGIIDSYLSARYGAEVIMQGAGVYVDTA